MRQAELCCKRTARDNVTTSMMPIGKSGFWVLTPKQIKRAEAHDADDKRRKRRADDAALAAGAQRSAEDDCSDDRQREGRAEVAFFAESTVAVSESTPAMAAPMPVRI